MSVTFDEAAACRRVFDAVPRQVELARRLGLTSSAISNLKKRQRCSLALVIAASEITGKPVEWFLFGERAGERRGLRERAQTLARATAEAAERSARLGEKLAVAEEETPYGDTGNLRTLLRLYEERIVALEQWVRVLELRIAELEDAGGGHDQR